MKIVVAEKPPKLNSDEDVYVKFPISMEEADSIIERFIGVMVHDTTTYMSVEGPTLLGDYIRHKMNDRLAEEFEKYLGVPITKEPFKA